MCLMSKKISCLVLLIFTFILQLQMDESKKPLLVLPRSALEGTDMQPVDLESPTADISGKKSTAGGHQPMTISWHSLHVDLPLNEKSLSSRLAFWRNKQNEYKPIARKRILKNVYGVAEPGQLLAILGSSGAGKTTLLNVLTKRNLGPLVVEGSVTVNGETLSGSKLRRVSAYVQQDDLFVGTLTVREHLNFHALLRMGSKYSAAERHKRVDDVMTELGLTKCQTTLVGIPNRIKGISGGERKRLAFASEILTNPSLLFCDEPTSGLDSFLAQQIVAVLKKLAEGGRTIVITIHQPSSQVFAMFDRICLMADGRVAFLGPATAAADLWQKCGYPCPPNYNPADHYLRTLSITDQKRHKESEQRIKAISDAYDQSAIGQETLAKAKRFGNGDNGATPFATSVNKGSKKQPKKYKAGCGRQMRALIWRSLMTTIREPMLLRVRLFQSILVAVLTGLVFMQTPISGDTIINVNGVLFQLVANMNFMFQFAVVDTFCVELPIFLREHLSGLYRVDIYYLSKMIAELPQYIFLPVIFASIVYWMAGLVADVGVFFIAVAVCVLMANAGISFGYAAACMFGNLGVAMTFLPVVVIPMLVFGGFYINVATIPAYFSWLRFLSYFGYSYEAMTINEWTHVDNIPGCSGNGTHSCPATGAEVLQTLNFDSSQLLPNIFYLLAIVIVVRFVGFLALLIRTLVKK